MGQYPNSALLFKNMKRQKDTEPHYRGDGEIDGVPYKISLWLRKNAEDKQFLKLSFTKAEVSEEEDPF